MSVLQDQQQGNQLPSAPADDVKAKLDLFINRHALTGQFPNAFTTHYMLGKDDQGRHIVHLQEERAALVLAKTGQLEEWTKSEFQGLAKPDVDPKLVEKACHDFNVASADDLKNLRSVGCGTSVILHLADGPFFCAVQRTAPKVTPDGVVNPGAYTRAAGGSTGDIDQSAFRELNEELFIVAKVAGRETALHILPDAYMVSNAARREIMAERRERLPGILSAQGHAGRVANHLEAETPCLSVAGLTEDVIERTENGDKVLKNRVFSDSPHQMDVNGIDAVTVLRLPLLSSKDIVGIYDGEMNLKGDLLKRQWSLFTLDDLYARKQAKELTMSPAPGRVIDAKDEVTAAIRQQLDI